MEKEKRGNKQSAWYRKSTSKGTCRFLELVGIKEVAFALDLQGETRFERADHSVQATGVSWAKMQIWTVPWRVLGGLVQGPGALASQGRALGCTSLGRGETLCFWSSQSHICAKAKKDRAQGIEEAFAPLIPVTRTRNGLAFPRHSMVYS